jgi:hypothetical protein
LIDAGVEAEAGADGGRVVEKLDKGGGACRANHVVAMEALRSRGDHDGFGRHEPGFGLAARPAPPILCF